MNIIKKVFILSFLSLILSVAPQAFAATPTLSLAQSGSSDGVLITVHGDANVPIQFYYSAVGRSGIQVQNIGSTDASGTFWNVVNTSTYSIDSSQPVYVMVNNQQSASQSWPYVTTNTTSQTGSLSLSQTSVTLSTGQSSTVFANNIGINSLYLSNNSNPSIANISVSGAQFSINAVTYGSTVVTVCVSGSNPVNCASVYVSIQNGTGQALSFSQNNVSVAIGQTLPITVTGGNGVYSIVNNSNTSAIQASVSGSVVNLYGNTSYGSATITVCSSNMASCGIINATIGTSNSSGITFSSTNVLIGSSQSSSVSISGGTGNYSVSNNTNGTTVSANISGVTLNLWGSTIGTATITICDSNGSCGSVTVTVNSGGGGGNITLSQSSANVLTNQSITISISGGTLPYSLVAGQTTIVQANLNNNLLTITGITPGSGTLSICSAGGGCTYLAVTVNGSTAGIAPTFSQNSLSLNVGQSGTITISGTGGYYVSSNSNSSVAQVTITTTGVIITASNPGSTSINICQTAGQCGNISVTVAGAGAGTVTTGSFVLNPTLSVGQTLTFTISGPSSVFYYLSSNPDSLTNARISGNTLTILGLAPGISSVSVCASNSSCMPLSVMVSSGTSNGTTLPVTTTPGSTFKFLNPLSLGSTGSEVTALQQRLTTEGFYTGPITGYYGQLTVAAVQAYQAHNGLSPLGNVGPGTRAMLNR